MNETMRKFGYPDALVRDYAQWCVLLRPAQATFGALVLVAKSEVRAFSDLDAPAFAELAPVVRDVEVCLREFSKFEKINYLMLMMVDPNVHFHVLPRYAGTRTFNRIVFEDRGWPGPPDLKAAPAITATDFAAILASIRSLWPIGGKGP
jgi:diadenosine tetraphosphate (Ap4A) HIT family hydrolase